jgi:hypothetical protein
VFLNGFCMLIATLEAVGDILTQNTERGPSESFCHLIPRNFRRMYRHLAQGAGSCGATAGRNMWENGRLCFQPTVSGAETPTLSI